MSRFPYPEYDSLPEFNRRTLEGAPLNARRMMAGASPGLLKGVLGMTSAIFNESDLPADLREIAILRAAYVAGSEYSSWNHESIAREVGLSKGQIDAIRQGGKHPVLLNSAQQAVLDFVNEFIVDAQVSDETLGAVRRNLSDTLVIDLMFITGHYMTLSRFLRTTGVERDAQAVSRSLMEANKESFVPAAQ